MVRLEGLSRAEAQAAAMREDAIGHQYDPSTPKAAGREHLQKLQGSGIVHQPVAGPGHAGQPRDEHGRWTK